MKVCVGLSGGVDSSVAALLLKRQGYDVFAMFMQNWHDADATLHGDCEWEEDRFIAEIGARKIGSPFYFIDLSKPYRARVVDYMFKEYERGRTPNPDVLCNREIKFDAFLEAARKLGADMVATGHYCRREPVGGETEAAAGSAERGEKGDPSQTRLWRLLEGVDPGKDQSYFLCQLSQEQLAHALFPIGGMLKSEVRALAAEADLPSADKKDSQGICFVGKVDLPTFLKQKIASHEGEIIEVYPKWYEDSAVYRFQRETLSGLTRDGVPANMLSGYVSEDRQSDPSCRNDYAPEKIERLDEATLERLSKPLGYDLEFETETYRSGRKHIKKTRWKDNPYGRIVGTHEGAWFYTIGQRKGLAVGGHRESLFIIATDPERNRIYVGEGHSHPGLSRSCLRVNADEIHWIRPDLSMKDGQTRRCRVRIRYRQPLQDATLIMREKAMYILFDAPQRGITPGQFAAWYALPEDDPANAEYPEVLGSGVIAE